MISPITSSTTLRVLEYGALNTATPALGGRGQVDLVGADAEAADASRSGAASSTRGVMWVLERIPSSWTPPASTSTSSSSESEPARSSTSWPRASQRLDGDRMDVLEEEDLHPARVGARVGRPENVALRGTAQATNRRVSRGAWAAGRAAYAGRDRRTP